MTFWLNVTMAFPLQFILNLLFWDFLLILTALSHFRLNVDLSTPFSTDILTYAPPTTSFIRKSSRWKIGILFPLTFVLVNFLIKFFQFPLKMMFWNMSFIFSLPFKGKHCIQIRSQLTKLLSSCFPQVNVCLVSSGSRIVFLN